MKTYNLLQQYQATAEPPDPRNVPAENRVAYAWNYALRIAVEEMWGDHSRSRE